MVLTRILDEFVRFDCDSMMNLDDFHPVLVDLNLILVEFDVILKGFDLNSR